MKKMLFTGLSTLLLITSGCSSITQNEMQTLALSAKYKNESINADCELSNDKGSWDASAPKNVSVHKSGEDLAVTCKKEGVPDGILKAVSRASGSMYGNIIFGGGIGAIIDHNKGTGYDYPHKLPVVMGESVILDRKQEKAEDERFASNDK